MNRTTLCPIFVIAHVTVPVLEMGRFRVRAPCVVNDIFVTMSSWHLKLRLARKLKPSIKSRTSVSITPFRWCRNFGHAQRAAKFECESIDSPVSRLECQRLPTQTLGEGF